MVFQLSQISYQINFDKRRVYVCNTKIFLAEIIRFHISLLNVKEFISVLLVNILVVDLKTVVPKF